MDIESLRSYARAALQNLEAHRQRIDDLNVYPVPDGDTGTNLVLTLRRIVETIEQSEAEAASDLAAEISRVALRAGKGNSGVIFSQIVRGFVAALGQAEDVTAPRLSQAFRAGSDAAYRAVSRVGAVEGTILTVIRAMAEEAEENADPDVSPAELLQVVLARGEEALARTPEMLEILARAGVVDAGGAGLVEIVRGVTLAANGEPLPVPHPAIEKIGADAIHQQLSRYRYCTGFVVEGRQLDATAFEEALGPLGDSLLVVGDDSALKVHVHTDDPGAALSAATAIGVIDEVEIADMYAQALAREARLLDVAIPPSTVETGIVAVAQGAGNRAIFAGENATVLEGGQTKNPTVEEIVDAIEAARAESVIVLPNNSNVVLAALEAATLTKKDVRVVPSRSIQAGIAAIERYVATKTLEDNERAMLEALESVATGEVTVASRDAHLDGLEIREGSYLGLVDGEAVAASNDFTVVSVRVIEHLLDGGRESVRMFVGENAPPLGGLRLVLEQRYPALDVEVYEGGQPHYPLLVVAE